MAWYDDLVYGDAPTFGAVPSEGHHLLPKKKRKDSLGAKLGMALVASAAQSGGRSLPGLPGILDHVGDGRRTPDILRHVVPDDAVVGDQRHHVLPGDAGIGEQQRHMLPDNLAAAMSVPDEDASGSLPFSRRPNRQASPAERARLAGMSLEQRLKMLTTPPIGPQKKGSIAGKYAPGARFQNVTMDPYDGEVRASGIKVEEGSGNAPALIGFADMDPEERAAYLKDRYAAQAFRASGLKGRLQNARDERARANAVKWAGSANPSVQRRGISLLAALDAKSGKQPMVAEDGVNVAAIMDQATKIGMQYGPEAGKAYFAMATKAAMDSNEQKSYAEQKKLDRQNALEVAKEQAGGKTDLPRDVRLQRHIEKARENGIPVQQAIREFGEMEKFLGANQSATTPTYAPGTDGTKEDAEGFKTFIANNPGVLKDKAAVIEAMSNYGISPIRLRALNAEAQPGVRQVVSEWLTDNPILGAPLANSSGAARLFFGVGSKKENLKNKENRALRNALAEAIQAGGY